jgi:hypothetical protein
MVFSYLGHIKLTMWEYSRYIHGRNSSNYINQILATNARSLQHSGEILNVQIDSTLIKSL